MHNLELKKIRLRKVGNAYAFLIPKAFVKTELLKKDEEYSIGIKGAQYIPARIDLKEENLEAETLVL